MGVAGLQETTAAIDARLTLPSGRAIGWAEYGDPAGYPVLYLHGWPGSRHQGARLDMAGWVAGARVVAPERPGYGLSDFAPGWSMLDWASDLRDLAEVLQLERFAILGTSGGGPYALACAATLPQRVSAVALASSVGPFDAPGLERIIATWRRSLARGMLRARLPLRLLLWSMARRVETDPDAFLEWSARGLPPVDREIVSQPDYRDIARRDITTALADGGRAATQDAQVLTGRWGFRLADIQTPVHLWYGGLDPIVPPLMGRHLADALPHATARYLPNEGHYLMVPRAVEILRTVVAAG